MINAFITFGISPNISFPDIDECSEDPDICLDGQCQNFIGGYHCRCNEGFRESTDMLQCFGKWCMYAHDFVTYSAKFRNRVKLLISFR